MQFIYSILLYIWFYVLKLSIDWHLFIKNNFRAKKKLNYVVTKLKQRNTAQSNAIKYLLQCNFTKLKSMYVLMEMLQNCDCACYFRICQREILKKQADNNIMQGKLFC